jgi:hypothetical protein
MSALIRFGLLLPAISFSTITSCSRGQWVASAYYFPIGAETLTPVTSDNIEKRGALCAISNPSDVSEIKELFDSAMSPTRPEHAFTNKRVRVKVLENTGRGDELIAIVENEGAIRRGDADRLLPANALTRLEEILHAACEWRR